VFDDIIFERKRVKGYVGESGTHSPNDSSVGISGTFGCPNIDCKKCTYILVCKDSKAVKELKKMLSPKIK
jgi:hypothetical protein